MNLKEKITWSFLGGIILFSLGAITVATMRFSKPEFKSTNQAIEKMFWKLNFGSKEVEISSDSTINIVAKTNYDPDLRVFVDYFEMEIIVKGEVQDYFILYNTKEGWLEIGSKENSEVLKRVIKLTYDHFWDNKKIMDWLAKRWPIFFT